MTNETPATILFSRVLVKAGQRDIPYRHDGFGVVTDVSHFHGRVYFYVEFDGCSEADAAFFTRDEFVTEGEVAS